MARRAESTVAACRSCGGFTLVELLITVAILSVLATAAMTVGELAVQRNKEQELRLALREIRQAIDAYKAAADAKRVPISLDGSGYPPTLQVLADGVADAGKPTAAKIYFLRRIPRDPMADAALPPTGTWGLRSYQSDAANPQPGSDVFDVYSMSDKVGINGLPYRQW